MRDELMMQLVDRALADERFREEVRNDPEGALRSHGYDLQSDELEAVVELQRETAGLSDEQLREAIAGGARRQGGGGGA